MNEKFFALPEEKQQRIINAGYRVFSENSYRKSPMSEIAAEAGISKSLLFHYFHNKRELYLFLWDTCVKTTVQSMTESGCYEQTDLFEMLRRGMMVKIGLMRIYPHMGNFALKVFYEKDPEVASGIQTSYEDLKKINAYSTLLKLDSKQFKEGIDISRIYKEMYFASVGYFWEMMQKGDLDVEKMEQDFMEMIEFWKKIFMRGEGE